MSSRGTEVVPELLSLRSQDLTVRKSIVRRDVWVSTEAYARIDR